MMLILYPQRVCKASQSSPPRHVTPARQRWRQCRRTRRVWTTCWQKQSTVVPNPRAILTSQHDSNSSGSGFGWTGQTVPERPGGNVPIASDHLSTCRFRSEGGVQSNSESKSPSIRSRPVRMACTAATMKRDDSSTIVPSLIARSRAARAGSHNVETSRKGSARSKLASNFT